MYEHILVAIDGSSTSAKALDEAIQLARQLKSKLRLLHVVDTAMIDVDNGGLLSMPEVTASLREGGSRLLKKSVAHAEAAGIVAESQLLETQGVTRVATEIVEDAKAWPADLIMLGTHGRRGFAHLLLGSIAEDVVRMATVPVLLIRWK
jgi:nucleotide-binding universal stress UspA family protein